jgi:hypothetical protein
MYPARAATRIPLIFAGPHAIAMACGIWRSSSSPIATSRSSPGKDSGSPSASYGRWQMSPTASASWSASFCSTDGIDVRTVGGAPTPRMAARAERQSRVTRRIDSSCMSSSCSAGPGMAGA